MKPTIFSLKRAWTLLALLFFVGALASARAQSLSVPGSVNGSLTSGHTIDTYSMTIPADGDVTFTIQTDSNLYALLRFKDVDGSTTINYVYDSQGQTATLTIPHLAPGATYYASVEIYSGSGNYTLSDTESTPPYAKATEPNDTPAQGNALTTGQTATGHVGYSTTSYGAQDNIDYYKFTVPADGDVTFTLQTDSTLYALLRFRDVDGNTTINYVYDSQGQTATLTIPHLAPGATYYTSVEVYSGYGSYQISSTLTQPPYAKAIEPNNTYKTAQALLVNKSVTGHVGYSTTSYGAQDSIDYWKFRASANGDVTFTITTDSTLYALLRFRDKDGSTTINYVYDSQGQTATLTIPHLGPGATYYVSVEVYSGYGSYKLANVLARQTVRKAKEPNNTYLQALPFTLNSTVTGNVGYSTKSYYTTDNIDYWKVTVANAGTLTVKVTTTGTLYALVRILNTDGTTTLNYVYCSQGANASVSYALPAAGTYFVSVEVYSGYGGYTLQNTF